ncbi:hypothetical protein PBY51_014486 [Eleginops maclovinus]|uniref:Uncharacterized protein n=1 Tax=Eleginops maclovinus TaxID=56733 RepID=A0AAN7WVG0_ELEMC|nr:hypothetical protein PBY51_014486 [Eleginops maclovinus]
MRRFLANCAKKKMIRVDCANAQGRTAPPASRRLIQVSRKCLTSHFHHRLTPPSPRLDLARDLDSPGPRFSHHDPS